MKAESPRLRLWPIATALILTTLTPTGGPVLAAEENDSNTVFDPALYSAMKYRLVGPFRGGRVTTVAGVQGQPYTFYFGSTGGGVWKTTSAGEAWENISDGFFGVGSIGAIAVAPSDPNVVYAGTGSACPRGNISTGDGIYRSTDAGKSWQHVGLGDTGQIGRIVVHPQDPDLVYVAALGHIFGPNEERGVFRSADGGQTWEKVLYVSDQAGAVDLTMNPDNPRHLFAAIWRAERKPWTMIDGSEESGLYRTTDGGQSWDLLTEAAAENGLPSGVLGRIGVAISPARSERVWALVTAVGDSSGLYRSEDGGDSWRQTSGDHRLTTRGWYYTHVHGDPADPDTVFVNNVHFLKSIDGGQNFEKRPVPHGDNHDLWINPNDTEIMIQANDGGANVTLDGGETWSSQHNQPTAEFYRVMVDSQFPYRLYGAQQDNSTISVPSWAPNVLTPEESWFDVGGGESGHIAVHPDDPNIVYAGTYIGRIDRYDRRVGFGRNVVIYPQMQDGTAPRDLKYRFQWNAPIRFSPHDPEVIYHTSNYVHSSRDGGMSWQTISPDLTRNDAEKQGLPGGPVQHDHTGVEVFNTIFAFEESPLVAGELWAGSDDGLVYLSKDAGATWDDVTPSRMTPDSTVNAIALSPHQTGRAFLAVHRYRMDDFRPSLWRTDDHGSNWKLLTNGSNGIPDDHPTRAIVEDPDRRGLLFAGTEFGLFVSFDDGAHWQTLQLNLPVTPITDLRVHNQDLVVATQGRSFWILDDLTPLHQLHEGITDAAVHLFKPRDSYRIAGLASFRGSRTPQQPDSGATLLFWLEEEPAEPVTLEILSSDGKVLRTFDSEEDEEQIRKHDEPVLPSTQGMNRFVWDLKRSGPELLDKALFSLAYTGAYYVLPGTYTARLKVGDTELTQPLQVLKDPRLTWVSDEDLRAQTALIEEIAATLENVHNSIGQLRSVRDQIRAMTERATKAGYGGEWEQQGEQIAERLTSIEEELIQTQAQTNQDLLNYPPRLDDQLAYLYSHVYQAYGRPTEGSYQRLEDLRQQLEPHLESLREVLESDLVEFDEALRETGIPPVIVLTRDPAEH
ncbi:MAG: glycosyl hydrolase [Thermoanaerobaculia bacterium]|jgi:photosystem II stability/assembly factor-like uncharacterized protein